MLKLILSAVIFFSGCAANNLAQVSEKETTPVKVLKPKLRKNTDGSIEFPTLYWANPRTVPADSWWAVFGGTVIKIKKEKTTDSYPRKYVTGLLKVEKIFLNLPGNSEISVNSVLTSEDFDGLSQGDKVIVFINNFYEGDFVRVEIEGTNTRLGFKVKDWNEPIVSVLEKIAPCDKTHETLVEYPKNSKALMYSCIFDRDKMILDDPQITKVWKRYDPKGFQYLVEMRKFDTAEK